MRNVLLLFFLTLLFNVKSQVNLSYLPNTSGTVINLGVRPQNSSLKRGPTLFFGGLSLIVVGVLMPQEYYITPSGYKVEKPFMQQTLKSVLILSGSGLTTIGIVFTIKDNKNE